MSSPAAIDVLRDRLKAFLIFSKSKLLADGTDLDRLAQLRRLSDVRLRRFAVGRAQITSADLAEFLSDPRSGRFDAQAREGGLLGAGHLAAALAPLGEEMGYVVEVALTQQVVGEERMHALIKEFVAKNGAAREAGGSAAPASAAPAAPKPLPPTVAKLLGGARELWMVPANVAKIQELLQSPDRPPDAACAEIERVPSLSAMLLRLLNASNAAGGTRMTSVKRAVVTVGYPSVRRAVATAALLNLLGNPPADYWPHSLAVAHASSLASRAAKVGNAEEHFAAGLLHDVGRLVVAKFLPGTGEPAGTTHAEIGGCVLERWKCSAAVHEAARHHRDTPEAFEEAQVPREAVVAAAMCRQVRQGAPIEAWSALLRLPAPRVQEILFGARTLAETGVKELAGGS